jgi:hypothetical protein
MENTSFDIAGKVQETYLKKVERKKRIPLSFEGNKDIMARKVTMKTPNSRDYHAK